MGYNHEKIIELYYLKASNFSAEYAPNQKKYYEAAARWLEENYFDSMEAVMAAMKQTEYYEGAAIAKSADEEHAVRKAREDAGCSIMPGDYIRRKELLGKIFNGYLRISGDPQYGHRCEAAEEIRDALMELQTAGCSFDEAAADESFRNILMASAKGIENFITFIHSFITSGYVYSEDLDDIEEEQEQIAGWVSANKESLMEIGKSETWHCANCLAVPSDREGGYDFIMLKEVAQ